MSSKIRSKRRVERVRARINITLASGNNEMVLCTQTDSGTLVRTIVQLHISAAVSAAAQFEFTCIIQLKPGGVTLVIPLVTAQLNFPLPMGVIWEYSGNIGNHTLVGDKDRVEIFVDLKGMRKFKEGDTIVLSIATVDAGTVNGTVVMFMKE